MVMYQCPRCDILFKKARSCSGCGQLILDEVDSLTNTSKMILHVGKKE